MQIESQVDMSGFSSRSLGPWARRGSAAIPWMISLMLLAPACGHTQSGGAPTRAPAPTIAAPEVARVERPEPRASGVAGVAELELAFESASQAIAPSVVSITSERAVEHREVPEFLRQFGPPESTIRGLGSGVILDAKGYILTNNHVVEGASVLRVRLFDEREFQADVVGTDPKTDLAVVRIDAENLVPAQTLGDDSLRVGQWVMAAGSPFGLSKSVSAGIVSAVGRGSMGIADYGDFIQTDAAINQGNSGGPLIDLRGRVIGINTAIASSTGGSNGVGFAIPWDIARGVMAQLIEHGAVERGWLGIVMGRLTPALAQSFGYSGGEGVLVDDIDPTGPAAASGVRAGDIVTHLDGKSLRDMVALRNTVAEHRPGTKVKLKIFRAGSERTIDLQLGALPGQDEGRARRPAASKPKVVPAGGHGLQLAEPTDDVRARWRVDVRKGAVVTDVAPRSVAERSIRPGDVITEVGDEAVQSAARAKALLDKAELGRGIRVRVVREGLGRYVLLRRDP